eukprot:2431024-Amphidinium_carterae.1
MDPLHALSRLVRARARLGGTIFAIGVGEAGTEDPAAAVTVTRGCESWLQRCACGPECGADGGPAAAAVAEAGEVRPGRQGRAAVAARPRNQWTNPPPQRKPPPKVATT